VEPVHDGITIIYDGHCPFCSSYVSMTRLRAMAGRVELVDARSNDPRVSEALSAGLELDRGMVVIWQDRTYFGRDAVHLLAVLSGPSGISKQVQCALFGTPRRAARIYPVLARGRRLFLRLSGRRSIGEMRKSAALRE
jgi:predicted DCC family thiol-disulfide oxidoreductase YuxK